ncbi:MAG TPA: radical SAM protein, partial [Candidatus Omnitrophica bacterium]|nr:radical SAM protein [Candidatus Omnitrophota bacterium]
MNNNKFKYIYGPVSSWRLGSSLGIDLISQDNKICSFDCIYCQISEPSALSVERKVFIPTVDIVQEIDSLPQGLDIDYATFSGCGEPTLALNIAEVNLKAKEILKVSTALLTNSSLLSRDDLRNDISGVDFVVAKLDAYDDASLSRINRPHKNLNFKNILDGIRLFRAQYKGKLGIQIMFTKENRDRAKVIAELVLSFSPDEVQLNTPLRESKTAPLSKDDMQRVEKFFKDFNVVSVYDKRKKDTVPLDKTEI